MAGSKQNGLFSAHVNDGGFHPHGAGAPVENRHLTLKLLLHMVCCGGADPPEAIGRWSGQSASKLIQQFKSQRMTWHANAHRVLASRQLIGNAFDSLQNERERPRPEGLHERFGPIVAMSPFAQPLRRAEVDDHRMIARSTFGLVEPIESLG